MLIAMTLATLFIAAAADLVWRGRGEADLRRRWRQRHRHPWQST